MEVLGGITIDEVIVFQTQLMLGAQFGRIKKKDVTKEDLMIACLRMGWNDAFRHTSENTKIPDSTKKEKDWQSVLESKEKEWQASKSHPQRYDDFICGNILNQDIVLRTFSQFVCGRTTGEKINCINNNFSGLKNLFQAFKKTDGDKQLCFGHFQKMFNIGAKLYVCLYLCRTHLKIDDALFDNRMIESMEYADCPIDSIILEKLSADTKTNYTNHKWSQYGTTKQPVDNYKAVQNAISEMDDLQGKSNLYYDFTAWKQP